MAMEQSPCELPMAQAAWLLATKKLPYALDYDARTMHISTLEPLARRVDEASWKVAVALLHATDGEATGTLCDIVRLPIKRGGMQIQSAVEVMPAAAVAQ